MRVEDVAQVDQHGVALVRRPEKFHLLQLALERCEERGELLLAGAGGDFFGMAKGSTPPVASLNHS